MILDLEPHLVHKVSSTWIVDLNVKSKKIKLLGENLGAYVMTLE